MSRLRILDMFRDSRHISAFRFRRKDHKFIKRLKSPQLIFEPWSIIWISGQFIRFRPLFETFLTISGRLTSKISFCSSLPLSLALSLPIYKYIPHVSNRQF